MTWVRGIGLFPTTAASLALGCNGFMNAGLGARLRPEDFLALLVVFLREAVRLAVFLLDFFLPAVFLLVVAIASLPA
ncbi:MAG TPA: hypothetical protein VFH40_16410 [Gemmatimonadales bacterium]|nr:hypothetical protein [Gemmatimonadales bacterium]